MDKLGGTSSLSLSLTDIKTPRTAYYRSLENFKLKKTPVLILFSSGHLQRVAVALATAEKISGVLLRCDTRGQEWVQEFRYQFND
jgi:hypothetical protein